MNPNSAEFRRANRQPSYQHMSREEYHARAYELAIRGEAIAKKLDAEKVREIRENRQGLTDKEQAIKFGVSAGMIYKIRHRMAWGCVK